MLDGLLFYYNGTDFRSVELIAVNAALLGLTHGNFRVHDERLRIEAIIRVDTYSDAGGHVQLVVVHEMKCCNRLQQSCYRVGGVFRLMNVLQKHHEFAIS